MSGGAGIQGFNNLETANQQRVLNYQANLQQGVTLNPGAREGFEAMVDRLSLFLNKAEDIGVNTGDGMTGDEYLLVSNAVSSDKGLQQQMQDLHQIYTDDFQNNIPKEKLVNGEDIFANIADLHGNTASMDAPRSMKTAMTTTRSMKPPVISICSPMVSSTHH